ncbi:Somatostatin receptor type 5 [Toxocara canis]|uniref:Somatostatin receptor type 5 n=1 Tax=Toxocara canis TaxID=6265 RepID=A0A0B2URC4_TOXCA|nr:Somatostatin receptor type 5 [Toxocara canis]
MDSNGKRVHYAMNSTVAPAQSVGVHHMRLALTITHLLLVSLGSVNMLVIVVIVLRPYMRSITNVYMIGLCLADFIYLTNLTLVAATQLNDKSWAFGSFICTLYHGTESTGKYASVMFVVLLAADRYYAMCRADVCTRYRNYRVALVASAFAWSVAIGAAVPLYVFAEVAVLRFRGKTRSHRLCIAKWPSSDTARWYITFSSILIFALPLVLIVFFYYHILNKLREALKGSKRLCRASSSRAPYHRVTRLVLWVVVFHVICWSPFWLFNLFSSIFRLRIQTQFDRIVINIIHLFPYVNCALNPILYAAQAENFRTAFRSLFLRRPSHSRMGIARSERSAAARTSCYRPDASSVRDPLLARRLSRNNARHRRMACKTRNHSVLKLQAVGVTGKASISSILDMNSDLDAPFTRFVTPALSGCKQFHDRWAQQTRILGLCESTMADKKYVSSLVRFGALRSSDELTPICSDESTDIREEKHGPGDTSTVPPTNTTSSSSYGLTKL